MAATLQLGLNERRGILSFDTPYFFKNMITSSFKAWEEDETYPSYRFNRWGLGATLVKKFSDRLYFLGLGKMVPHHADRFENPGGVQCRPVGQALRHDRPLAIFRQ